jgi:hypothetical protein
MDEPACGPEAQSGLFAFWRPPHPHAKDQGQAR